MPTLKELEIFKPIITAEELTVWKKAFYICRDTHGQCLVELRLPKRAKLNICTGFSIGQRKCRASSAYVVNAICLKTEKKLAKNIKIFSKHNSKFTYTVGKKIKPTRKFDESDVKCAAGIHFFLRRGDAKRYKWT